MDSDIVISDDVISNAVSGVKSTKVSSDKTIANGGVQLRNARTKARIETSKIGKVSVTKQNLSADIDVAEAVTPFVALEFEPKSVSELNIENT